MMRVRAVLAVAATAAALAVPVVGAGAAANVLVVSPHGSDRASGSAAHPLRTIALAVGRLAAGGGVVELRGGVYHQRVHLVGVHGVTVRPYDGEHAELSGYGLTPPAGLTAMVEIADSSDVTVRDLDITGYRTTKLNRVPAGVYVHGHDSGVRILDNNVHDLGNDNNTLGSFEINAHGIAAYGDDPHAPITGLRISGNTVDNLQLGASETVVVNGNVTHWAITGNDIHDDNNIGIDAIGFEPTLSGRYRYTHLNRARHGLIAGNHVSRIRSQGNPAYWEGGEWCNCADGIYVDGGTHIRIHANRVRSSDIGIEVAAENAHGEADHVLVDDNAVTGSVFTGITTGGYCNGARSCGGVQTGASYDNVFRNNRLRGNNRLDDGSPELLIQYHAYRDTFEHNTITATNGGNVVYGTVPHDHVPARLGVNRSDHNHFSAVGASPAEFKFGWRGHTYRGAGAYRAATGEDAHSTFG